MAVCKAEDLDPVLAIESLTNARLRDEAWHADIVDQALVGFKKVVGEEDVDVFDFPGAYELPLFARDLALTKKYATVAAADLVVDGGIYRHDFVAQAVFTGLMQAGLETGVPILSISLTPPSPFSRDRRSYTYLP